MLKEETKPEDVHIKFQTYLKEKMEKAMDKLNAQGLLNIDRGSFIRLAIDFYSDFCLEKDIGLIYKNINGKKFHKPI